MSEDMLVSRNDDENRYEIRIGGELAGFAVFEDGPERRDFTHTEVFPEYEDHGVGSRLVQDALSDTVSDGRRIRPYCSYVAHWVSEHPEYSEHVDATE